MFFAFFAANAFAQISRIYSISPSQVQTGATAFPIVVTGSNFKKNSVVQINGITLDTYFISWNKLRATVPANLAASAGVFEVRVLWKNRPSTTANLTISNEPVGNYDWSALTARLESFVPGTVPGLTFQITRHGKTIYTKSFGNQTDNSVLPIASATKMPSALAILTLVDEGRLDLDAPISIYLNNGYATVPADKALITTRMLLNHTSGLSQSDCLNNQANTTLRQCVQQILNLPLGFAPGTRFGYGGSSFQFAGGVVEAITGQSWYSARFDAVHLY